MRVATTDDSANSSRDMASADDDSSDCVEVDSARQLALRRRAAVDAIPAAARQLAGYIAQHLRDAVRPRVHPHTGKIPPEVQTAALDAYAVAVGVPSGLAGDLSPLDPVGKFYRAVARVELHRPVADRGRGQSEFFEPALRGAIELLAAAAAAAVAAAVDGGAPRRPGRPKRQRRGRSEEAAASLDPVPPPPPPAPASAVPAAPRLAPPRGLEPQAESPLHRRRSLQACDGRARPRSPRGDTDLRRLRTAPRRTPHCGE